MLFRLFNTEMHPPRIHYSFASFTAAFSVRGVAAGAANFAAMVAGLDSSVVPNFGAVAGAVGFVSPVTGLAAASGFGAARCVAAFSVALTTLVIFGLSVGNTSGNPPFVKDKMKYDFFILGYMELEVFDFQFFELVGKFNILVPPDLLAVYHEANRYRQSLDSSKVKTVVSFTTCIKSTFS